MIESRRAPRAKAAAVAWLALFSACASLPGPDLSSAELVAGGDARFERLARDFYARLENRRFNSISTFQDPGLHELFRSREAYQDYYAGLAYELEIAHFEASRPTRVAIATLRRDGETRIVLGLRFVGENGLPLRWWKVVLEREDTWERDPSGRWWILPGKV